MTKAKADRVDVQILDRSYQLSCRPEEKDLLMDCVALVDTRMRQAKAHSKIQGADRIAVLAALTIARECLTNPAAEPGPAPDSPEAAHKIAELTAKLEAALFPQERLF